MSSAPTRGIPWLTSLCVEQIKSRFETEESAVLVDQFGLAHRLAPTTILGREPEDGLAILEGSVSRTHAEVAITDQGWTVRDLDSTNGTFLNGHRVSTIQKIDNNQLLVVGDVGFLFFTDGQDAKVLHATESIRNTSASSAKTTGTLFLSEPTGGGGGQAEFQKQQVQLGIIQYALLEMLAHRFTGERHNPDDVRGFIPSTELLAELPWNTPYPSDNHLKQLVRRVRRALEQIELTDAIESRQRFGYRLRVEPAFRG